MALIRLDHVPETVRVNLPLNILLPDPGQMQGKPLRERKVLLPAARAERRCQRLAALHLHRNHRRRSTAWWW